MQNSGGDGLHIADTAAVITVTGANITDPAADGVHVANATGLFIIADDPDSNTPPELRVENAGKHGVYINGGGVYDLAELTIQNAGSDALHATTTPGDTVTLAVDAGDFEGADNAIDLSARQGGILNANVTNNTLTGGITPFIAETDAGKSTLRLDLSNPSFATWAISRCAATTGFRVALQNRRIFHRY